MVEVVEGPYDSGTDGEEAGEIEQEWEFGGMSGAEETKRAVSKRWDGSSASVSVSSAQSWQDAVHIVFNAAVRERLTCLQDLPSF